MIELHYNPTALLKLARLCVLMAICCVGFSIYAALHDFSHDHHFGRGAIIEALGSRGGVSVGLLGAVVLGRLALGYLKRRAGDCVAIRATEKGLMVNCFSGRRELAWDEVKALRVSLGKIEGKKHLFKGQSAPISLSRLTVFSGDPPPLWKRIFFESGYAVPIGMLDVPEPEALDAVRHLSNMRDRALGIHTSEEELFGSPKAGPLAT
jgi:hypothetical protein